MTSLFPPFPFPPFPEIGLPIFLQPLRLVPHYQAKLADSLKDWLDGRHTQIFGPLEQAVAATVVVGLAMQTPPDFWSASSSSPQPHAAPAVPPDNATTNAAPPSTSSTSGVHADRAMHVSNWLGHLRGLVEQYLPSPMTLALIAMMLNLAVMLIPPELRNRLKESWDLFWPPWQIRASASQSPLPTANHSHRDVPPTESERARETKADSRSADSRRGMTEEEKARPKEKQRAKMAELARGDGEERNQEARDREREKERAAPDRDHRKKEPGDESAMSAEEKAKLKAKQKARLDAAEKAREAGEGLTSEEKEKIRAKQKARMAAEKEKDKGKSASGTEMTEDKKARLGPKLKARELEKAGAEKNMTSEKKTRTRGREEKMNLAAVPKEAVASSPVKGDEPDGEEAKGEAKSRSGGKVRDVRTALSSDRTTSPGMVSAETKPPEGLSRSELARWMKRWEQGGRVHAVSTDETDPGKASRVRPREPRGMHPTVVTGAKSDSSPRKSALRASSSATSSTSFMQADSPRGSALGPPSDREDPGTRGASDTSGGASSGEDDALMAGDYRPLKSALKKSKKKPRQKKNIHHNYFMTMRGYKPHLIPFPHGLHPKPYHPRHTLWWDNIPKNADHIMVPPPVPKKPEDAVEDEDKKVVKTPTMDEKGESEADGPGGAKSKGDRKTTVKEERSRLSEENDDNKRKKKGKDDASNKDKREKTPDERIENSPAHEELSSRSKEKMRSAKKDGESTPNRDGRTVPGESSGSKGRASSGGSSSDQAKSKDRAEVEKLKEREKLEAKEAQREKERAEMKAAAEAEKEKERAKAKAKMGEAKGQSASGSSSSPPIPAGPPQADPQLRRANFVAQGMLCSLIYMGNEQLALLLMAFFVYTHIQAQHQQRAPRPTTSAPAPGPTPSREASAAHRSASSVRPSEAPSREARSSDRNRPRHRSKEEIPPEMGAKLDAARSAGPSETEIKPTSHASTRPKSLDDLTPERRERYLPAKAARQAPAKSDGGLNEDGWKSRKRVEDMPEAEKEAYLRARAKGKAVEAAAAE